MKTNWGNGANVRPRICAPLGTHRCIGIADTSAQQRPDPLRSNKQTIRDQSILHNLIMHKVSPVNEMLIFACFREKDIYSSCSLREKQLIYISQ